MTLKRKRYKLNPKDLREDVFNDEVLAWIAEENLWNIWIPKSHGGLELSFNEGLQKLRSLAEIDGSLGWTVTLCSGANFFFGNLEKEVADAIFINPQKPVCFGGSGGVFGVAEKVDNGYVISGVWKYATGAPFLTHFTLNAKILENGKMLLDENGDEMIRSFVVDKEDVEVIQDWNAMGLKATATHSFEVKETWIHEKYSFIYNEHYHDASIFKINFSVFADLTLWVNYIGMATHFYKEAQHVLTKKNMKLNPLIYEVEQADIKINQYVLQIEASIKSEGRLPNEWIDDIHREASNSVKALTESIIKIYPLLGIKGCSETQLLNQIFKDYFTATQHHIFSRN